MISVGTNCVIERRYSHAHGGPPQHRWESVVTRVTAKRAYFASRTWFDLDDPEREVKPKYLDYRTVVVSVEPFTSDGGPK